MRLKLKELVANPFRNFDVDPLDNDNIAELTKSIKQDGFWGGVVVRKHDGEYQIACGHHRVAAAIKLGMDTEDLFVLPSQHSDAQTMVRIYARENATQRGNTSTAATGTVAAAIQCIAHDVLSGTSGKFTGRSAETVRGQIESEKGLGRDVVLEFIGDVPNVTENTVRQQMASLKASGDYAKIIAKVRKQINAEGNEKAKESARKAEESAAKTEVTFDFKGVAKHLKNDNQLRTFRDIVTGEGIAPYLPVSQQAALAKELVAMCSKKPGDGKPELSSRFIQETVVNMVLRVKRTQKKMSAEEKQNLERANKTAKAKRFMHEFSRNVKSMITAGVKLHELEKGWPKDFPFTITGEFRSALRSATIVITTLNKRFPND